MGPERVVATTGAVAYAALAVFRYDRFGAGAYDLGIFDQTVWTYSRLRLGPNTVKGVPLLLGDHFHPIVALAAPLYRLWADPRMLLLLQAVLLGAASLPLYSYARARLGSRSAALLVQVAFLASAGIASGALFDFHEVAFAVPLLATALWALHERRVRLFAGCCLAGVLVKEDVALLSGLVALYGAVRLRRPSLVAIGIALAGASLLLVAVVIPALGRHAYAYWSYGSLGSSPAAIVGTIARHPLRPVALLVDAPAKRWTLAALLGSWCLLPLASPLLVLAALPVAERMWNANPHYWELRYHYSLTVAPILAFAAVDGLARLRRRAVPLAALALAATAAVTAATVGRERLSGLPAAASAAAERCLGAIPADASVVASAGLVPHLSRRSEIWTFDSLPPGDEPDVVALDPAAWPLEQPRGRRSLARVERSPYRTVCRGGGAVVLERLAAATRSSSSSATPGAAQRIPSPTSTTRAPDSRAISVPAWQSIGPKRPISVAVTRPAPTLASDSAFEPMIRVTQPRSASRCISAAWPGQRL